MHRCSSVIFSTLAIIFPIALTGCLGKSSGNAGNGGVSSVRLLPSGTTSIDVGTSRVFFATALNAGGNTIVGGDLQYIVQSGNPNVAAPLSIAGNGNACAGTWDVTVSFCSPGTPGIAVVTAIINGVSSPPTTVYVHQHVDSIQITNAESKPPLYDCFSQGQSWQYGAVAFSNNVDITSSVGPFTWSSSNAGVVTATPIVAGTSQNPVYQVQTTAAAPGITQLFANVSGTTSNPFPYTTCLIKAIYLQVGGQSQGGSSVSVTSGGSVSITAIAVDTLYNLANTTPLLNPPLTWNTSHPEVAAFTTTTNNTRTNTATARNNLGGAALSASCTPPSCNIGVVPSLPIYSTDCNVDSLSTPCLLPGGTKGYGVISVDVTSASTPPTYSAWAATTGCQDASGCSSALFSVAPGTTPIGSILSLPRTPNSLMFNHQSSSRLYIGSNQGLMFVDVSANSSVSAVSTSPTPCKVSLCGKVLTISNDGNRVVVADTVSTPSQIYIYTAGGSSAPIDLVIPGETPTAAAFSPDQLKLFILTSTGSTGRMYVYSTVDALTSVSIADSATDVKFSLNGSFAYVAGTPSPAEISAFATCDDSTISVVNGPITTAFPTVPQLALFPLPERQLDSAANFTEVVLALDPPNIDKFGVNVEQNPLPMDYFFCKPPTVTLDTSFPKTSVNLGKGDFTPIYAQVGNDGNEFIVVAKKIPAVLLFDVSNGFTTAVPLFNGADPLAASGSPDGSQIFVAACDQYAPDGTTCAIGSVHIVSTVGQGDYQQVPYVNPNNNNRNMCSNGGNPTPQCLPDLIAVKPQ